MLGARVVEMVVSSADTVLGAWLAGYFLCLGKLIRWLNFFFFLTLGYPANNTGQ